MLPAARASAQGGMLQSLRDEVRGVASGESSSSSSSPSESSSEESCKKKRRQRDSHFHFHFFESCSEEGCPCSECRSASGGAWLGAGFVAAAAITSPWWGPHAMLADDFGREAYFARFPYDGVPGYMMVDGPVCFSESESPEGGLPGDCFMGADCWPSLPRCWAARLSVEYADQFDVLTRIEGSLLVSTASRWELDTQFDYLEEQLPGGGWDHLWLGDCNVTLRFAQSECVQFRSGIGFNWMDDAAGTDFGFNFTYGADFFPGRPWVVSAGLDWGTLGKAELFRFRTTLGAILHRAEVYTGYEYLDIDTVQVNSLLAGVRLWF